MVFSKGILSAYCQSDYMQLTAENIAIIQSHLKDRNFRLRSGMYKIIDAQQRLVPFKPNHVQEIVLANMHSQNIYLKSRQHGLTTLIQIWILDDTLFAMVQDSAVIAHKREDAGKFFNSKIKLAFNNLPTFMLDQAKVVKSDAMTLSLNNGASQGEDLLSNIFVTTSARSGTLKNLHISEYGHLCTYQPQKAEEVKAGSLNSLHDGSKLFIESTAEGPVGDFYNSCKIAQEMQFRGDPLSRFDRKFFFFSWFQDKRNSEPPPSKEYQFSADMVDYFKELEDVNKIKLTTPQKFWYYKKAEEQGEAMFKEHPSSPEEAFKAIIKGAIYAKQITSMRKEQRLTKVPYDPQYLVHTAWDLGRSKGNAMSIVFFQFDGLYYRYIDYFYEEFSDLKDTCRQVLKKEYIYGSHFAPHDIGVRELTAGGKTRAEMCAGWGIDFEMEDSGKGDGELKSVLNKTSAIDRYEAGRIHMDISYFDVDNTGDRDDYRGAIKYTKPGLLTSLQQYRHEYDESKGMFMPEPEHNWASNLSDAFGYSAQATAYVKSRADVTVTSNWNPSKQARAAI